MDGDSNKWRLKLYRHLKKSLTPLCHDRFENYNHGMAKARCAHLLEKAGYKVLAEMPMPCNDTINPAYVHPFRVDIYAELWLPMQVSIGPGYIDVTMDVIVIEIGGLSGLDGTKHAKNKMFAGRTIRKKEMICQHYKIPEEKYLILERDEVFSSKYIIDDAALYAKFGLKDRGLP